MLQIPGLYTADSELSGRGVFCANEIPPDCLIEICPVIKIPISEITHLEKTTLFNYYFEWGEDNDEGAIALGLGSLYNHSTSPNARYLIDLQKDTIDFYSIKEIQAGEEITVNYLGLPGQKGKVWFQQ